MQPSLLQLPSQLPPASAAPELLHQLLRQLLQHLFWLAASPRPPPLHLLQAVPANHSNIRFEGCTTTSLTDCLVRDTVFRCQCDGPQRAGHMLLLQACLESHSSMQGRKEKIAPLCIAWRIAHGSGVWAFPGGVQGRLYLLCISPIYFLLSLEFTIRTQLSVFIITPALVDEAIAMHSLCLLLLLLLMPLLARSRGSWFAPGCLSWFWPSKCWPTCKGAQVCDG